MADEIRSDMEGKSIGALTVGLVVCITLYCLVLVCHRLDARAEAEARAAGSDAPAVEKRPAPAVGKAVPRARLRLVSSGVIDTQVASWAAGQLRVVPSGPEQRPSVWAAAGPMARTRTGLQMDNFKNSGFPLQAFARPFRYVIGM